MNRWAGPILAFAVGCGVVGVLYWNLETSPQPGPPDVASSSATQPAIPAGAVAGPDVKNQNAGGVVTTGGFREYPIGETDSHHMTIAAVWLPSIHMEGQAPTLEPDLIHLEADIHALEEHPNGFALGEFIPYLRIHYRIADKSGDRPPIEGTMVPMVARDGLHYGVSLPMPVPGEYTLTYKISPPSAGGLGRHDDPVTGVGPWWDEFEVSFPWKVEGPVAP